METIQAATSTAVKTGTKKERFAKLKLEDLAGLPGVNVPATAAPELGVTYSLCLDFPLASNIGNSAGVAELYSFVDELDATSKSEQLGFVTSVTFSNSTCEVLLYLMVSDKQVNPIDPARRTFGKLTELISRPLFKQMIDGKPVRWRAKANGSIIADQSF